MTLSVSTHGAEAKIKRAHKHIDNLQAEINSFLARKPYRLIAKRDGEWERWVGDVLERVPDSIPLLIGDAAHNLRSALDHIVFEIVKPTDPKDIRDCAFPFSNGDAKALVTTSAYGLIKRKVPKLADAIEAMNPHNGAGSNWALIGLHNLDITDKHRLIVAVAAATSPQVKLTNSTGLDLDLSKLPALGPVEQGRVLFTCPPHTNVNPGDEIPATFTIKFAEGMPLAGQPIVELLAALAQATSNIVGILATI